jgi:hypothetical protein
MEQQDAARRRAVAAAVALAVARTREFDDWYSTAAIKVWATALALAIEAIQRNLARQTDAILARQASVMAGRTVRPVGAIDVTQLRKGVTHAGVYGRIADTYRYQKSLEDAGQQVQAAMEAAVQRAEVAAQIDSQLVVREQSHKTITGHAGRAAPEGRRVIGWRRIVHPELSEGGSCGMCIVASTRLYQVERLMEIHPGCNCLPMEVYDGADPGGLINDEDLERFYAEAGGKQIEELAQTRYQVNEHGELGPVMARSQHRFRTAEDVEKDER